MRDSSASDLSSTCIQRVYPHVFGVTTPNKSTSPHPTFQMQQIKQEPMEEDRNDSGVNSEGSFHSSSPRSENSQDFISNPYPLSSMHLQQQAYYNQFAQAIPPQYPRYNLPATYQQSEQSTTDMKVPPENNKDEESDNPLQRLQFTLEKNGLLPPPISPPSSEHSGDEDKKSDCEGKDFDELGVHTPRINSHGKVKTFKCKYCTYVTVTKHDYWEHLKDHIKEDKRLNCHMCGFITEYKHHLEYHLRNHDGSKPFKCNKCSYSCVNKSMLSSHMKSHSNVYQYRCSDCSYATKYCHSLKLHLRKYDHSPAMVLNPDGTPNPLPIIDVYGTRRGPKQKSSLKCDKPEQQTPPWPNPLTHLMMNSMQLPFPYHLLAGLQNQNQFPQLEKQGENDDSIEDDEQQESEQVEEKSPTCETDKEAQVLDLSKNEASNAPAEVPIKTNRRKGPAYKLENLRLNESSEDDDEEDGNVSPPPAPPATVEKVKEDEGINNNNNNDKTLSFCQYCNISFGDIVMYTMHMGYHGYKDPFKCNMCGEQSNDRVSFFLHIVRNAHT